MYRVRKSGKRVVTLVKVMRANSGYLVVFVLAVGLFELPLEAHANPGPPGASKSEAVTIKDAQDAAREAEKKANEQKFDEAAVFAERAVAIYEKVAPQSKVLAVALRNLAEIHRNAGRYALAVPPLEKALAIDEKLGTKGIELKYIINAYARALADAKMHERAIAAYQRELALSAEIDGSKDGHRSADPLIAIARPYSALHRYPEAEQGLLRAVKIYEPQGPHSGLHHALLELGRLYRDQGLYARAEPVLQRALRVSIDGPGLNMSSEHMRLLATTLMALENYDAAKVLLDKLLDLAKAAGEERLGYAYLLGMRGDLDMQMGAYDRAAAAFTKAQDIADKLAAKGNPAAVGAVAAIGGARGRLLLREGDWVRAEKLLMAEKEFLEKKFGANDRLVGDVSAELAELHRLAGHIELAESYASRSLAIRDDALAETHPDRAESRAVLGRIRELRGDLEGAKKLHVEALNMRDRAFGSDHPQTGASVLDLADLARRHADVESAERYYKRAIFIYEKVFGPDHAKVAQALEGLSALYAATNKMELALRLSERAVDSRERQTSLFIAGGSDAQKRAFLHSLRVGTDFVTSLHTRNAPTDEKAKHLALTTIFQRKGRVLDVMAGTTAALKKHFAGANSQLFDELVAARADVARLALRGPAGAPLDEFRAELTKREEKARALEEKLGGQSDVFRAEQIPVSIERVQAAIPEGMVLVEFSSYTPRKAAERLKSAELGPQRFVAYVIDGTGKVRFVDLGEAAPIELAVRALREVLSSPDRGDTKKPGRILDELVMQKVRPLLGGKTRVLISADGVLSLVPFAALVDENNKYLVESLEMTYLTSGRDLIRLSRQNKAPATPSVVLANPAFGQRERGESALDLLQEGSSRGNAATSDESARGLEKAFFTPLPATGVEAKKLAALMPNASVLVDVDATESALKKVHAPRMLHIATHGFFVSLRDRQEQAANSTQRGLELDMVSPDWLPDDPLLRSGIALAGANAHRGGGGEDGILTALEACSLDLQGTKMVVLSACETGLGDVMQGEGIYGLRRALFIAGAESLLASLWQVADDETQALMVAFYGRVLKRESRAAGLRNVQLSMLAEKATAHPYYWASFGLFGNASVLGEDVTTEPTKLPLQSASGTTVKVPPAARGCTCDTPGQSPMDAPWLWLCGALGWVALRCRRQRIRNM